MTRRKVMALTGSIIYTIFAVLDMMAMVVLASHPALINQLLERYGLTNVGNSVAIGIIIGILIVLAITAFNWIAFIKIGKPKEKGWVIYLFVIGIIYGLASLINGVVGILLQIPIAVFFILTFVFWIKDGKNNNTSENNSKA
ncbi:MAG: hypothetical protein FWF14_05805 [Streptococcaceae bacterium]|nr:hypothetical protein [Streptococcaceae bacterium]